jgi:ferredoxin
MNRFYAVCPVCAIHIPLTALKDEESFTGEEATVHIEDAHPEVCTDLGVPYFSIHLSDSPPPDCSWCGGACDEPRPFLNRRGEVFCSPNHRSSSNRALRRLAGEGA